MSNNTFRIDIDEEESYRPVVSEAGSLINARGIVANPSIGEVWITYLSMSSAAKILHLYRTYPHPTPHLLTVIKMLPQYIYL